MFAADLPFASKSADSHLPLPQLPSDEVAICDRLASQPPMHPDALWELMQKAGKAAAEWLRPTPPTDAGAHPLRAR